MKHLNRFACALVALGAFALPACGGGDDEAPIGGTPDAGGNTQITGPFTHYVNTELKFGANAAAARDLSFADLDGKGDKTDNYLGELLAGFNDVLGLDTALKSAVDAGTIVILHSVRADDLANDPSVSWQVWLGTPRANPFDGMLHTVASNSPTNAKLTGSIAAGKFTGQAEMVTIEVALTAGAAPLRIDLYAPHIVANVTANGCAEGRIAGAITQADVNSVLAPVIADVLDARIAADSGCRDALANCESANQFILTVFDPNMDRMITADDVRAGLALLATPDVDVLPTKSTMNADAESFSVTLGFSCAKATYTAPGE